MSSPAEQGQDHYATLSISPEADESTIKSSYRKLALKQHPDRNPGDPKATQRFQSLGEAYAVLSDPENRQVYDKQRNYFRSKHATTSRSGTSSGSQTNSTRPEGTLQKVQELDATVEQLRQLKATLAWKLAAAGDVCTRSRERLSKLQAVVSEDERVKIFKKTWLGYLFFQGLSADEERRMIDRRAAQTIREAEVRQYQAAYNKIQADLERYETEFQIAKSNLRLERLAYETTLRTAEANRQRAQHQEWLRTKARQDAERARQEREQKMKEQEQRRKAEEQEEEQAAKRQEEQQRKAREQTQRTTKPASRGAKSTRSYSKKSCIHKAWWTQKQGRAVCQACHAHTLHFAFQCPQCRMIACADCRNILKNG